MGNIAYYPIECRYWSAWGTLLAVLVLCLPVFSAPGDFDPTFSPDAESRFGINCLSIQPDGKILIGGGFTTIDGWRRSYLARLLPDGDLDLGFDAGAGFDHATAVIAVQRDGRIIVGGHFQKFDGHNQPGLVRLHPDGTIDLGFRPVVGNSVRAVAIQDDGKILISRRASGSGGDDVIRLNPDGQEDATFIVEVPTDGMVTVLKVLAGGHILIGGNFRSVHGVTRNALARLTPDGAVDEDFLTDFGYAYPSVRTVAALPSGKLVVGGRFSSSSQSAPVLVRLNADGSIESVLASVDLSGGGVDALALQADGKIVVVGGFSILNGNACNNIARLSSTGVLDSTFVASLDWQVSCLSSQPDGRLIVGGFFSRGVERLQREDAVSVFTMETARLFWQRTGSLEEASWTEFEYLSPTGEVQFLGRGAKGTDGWEWTGNLPWANGAMRARAYVGGATQEEILELGEASPEIALQQPVGRPLIAGSGQVHFGTLPSTAAISRILTLTNEGGAALENVSANIVGPDASSFELVQSPRDKHRVGSNDAIVVRFTATGVGARTATLRIASNDGDESIFEVALFGESVDTVPAAVFSSVSSTPLVAEGYSPTGKEIGSLELGYSPAKASILTLVNNTSGSQIDGFFANLPEGGYIQASWNGARLLFQASYQGGTGNDLVLMRVGPGVPDSSWSFQGSVVYEANAVAIQPDGKMLIGGSFEGSGTNRLVRVLSTGELDLSFDSGTGCNGQISSIAVQEDGEILVAGYFTTYNGVNQAGIVRLMPDGGLDSAFPPEPIVLQGVDCIALQPDGKILVANSTSSSGKLIRLMPDGSLDGAFRFNTTPSFATFSGQMLSILVEPTGSILIGGGFGYTRRFPTPSVTRSYIARLSSTGALDVSFNSGVTSLVGGMQVAPDGKILVAPIDSFSRVVRLQANGAVDAEFGLLDNQEGLVGLQADGGILHHQGMFVGSDGTYIENSLVRTASTGSVDVAFGLGLGFDSKVSGATLLPSGKILVTGLFSKVNTLPRNKIVVLHNDAAVDVLSRPNLGSVRWRRGGSAPEAQWVTFDTSTDGGGTWTRLGTGARTSEGWELNGVTMPESGLLRGRARVASGRYNTCASLLETRIAFNSTLPELVLEQPVTKDLVSNVDTVSFGNSVIGVPNARQFTLRNTSGGTLTINGVAIHGDSALGFAVTSQSPATLEAESSASFTVSFTAQYTGASSAELHIESNDSDENPFIIQLTGSGLSAQQGWRQTHFSTTANSGSAADLFDFDGDGLPNVLEYAFGLHPKQNSAGQTPQPFLEGEYLVIRFTAPAGVTGVTYGAVASPDLSANSWTPVLDSGVGDVHEFKVPTSSGGRRFMKLTVTTP
ncbi:choice-of-anchor D domain-containing protein [Verrucomicrobium sp. BvORR106]|uniref:choice-of-anchor D domain-containing protein n=1 Tax=Verrucomicrobium sp. BvORR106 TaxID=1403819 RepID=UPI0009DE2A5F|nr:choice-of-anchor D domain-containing protein [Verrucomicrobium sp. BvORR106]